MISVRKSTGSKNKKGTIFYSSQTGFHWLMHKVLTTSYGIDSEKLLMRGMEQAWRQSSANVGAQTIFGGTQKLSLQFKSEDHKKGFCRKKCAKFHEYWGVDRTEKKSSQNLQKNGCCSRILGWWQVFWGIQVPNCTPVALSLLLPVGLIPRLGKHFSFGEAWPRNAPCGARPGIESLIGCGSKRMVPKQEHKGSFLGKVECGTVHQQLNKQR